LSTPTETKVKPQRGGVQSVEHGLRVAKVFTTVDGPLALKDVSRLAGLGASKAHRYLASLVRAGLLRQIADGRYDLGPMAVQFGFAGLARLDAVQVATEQLQHYVEESGNTGMLSVWTERGPLVIRYLQGAHPVYSSIAVGAVTSLDSSATGRVFQTWDTTIKRSVRGNPRTLSDIERKAVLNKVREQGYATVAGDFIPGLFAAAAPIFDGSHQIVSVLTGISTGMPLSERSIAILVDKAAKASAALGLIAP
jgi:DNA-binding IclR family transcriptional regulator